ncbi:MAG: hypothetical protein AB7G13_08810 [Lautropia sp.]
MIKQPSYPALRFVQRFGGKLAVIVAFCVAGGGVRIAVMSANWWWGVGGIATGALVFLAIRSCYELVLVLADTLLPE